MIATGHFYYRTAAESWALIVAYILAFGAVCVYLFNPAARKRSHKGIRWFCRHAARGLSLMGNWLRGSQLCTCGHPRSAHMHYRPGTDCALCPCRRFRKAPGRLARGWRWARLGRAERDARRVLRVPAGHPERVSGSDEEAGCGHFGAWADELARDGIDAGLIIDDFRREGL